jgi:hypothetical protein
MTNLRLIGHILKTGYLEDWRWFIRHSRSGPRILPGSG